MILIKQRGGRSHFSKAIVKLDTVIDKLRIIYSIYLGNLFISVTSMISVSGHPGLGLKSVRSSYACHPRTRPMVSVNFRYWIPVLHCENTPRRWVNE